MGGRTVLIVNACALMLAVIVTAEGAYIQYELLGRFLWDDYLSCFLPALVAVIIRDARFSSVFLVLYAGLAIILGDRAWSVYSHTYKSAGAKDLLGPLGVFDLISLLCLAIYLVVISLRMLARVFSSRSVS
jgi:hypothetical protein